MNNNYYTPDISEFFVGFEYEEAIECGVQDNPYYEWVKQPTFPEAAGDHAIGNIEYLLTEDRIRVKYLDKEDIESLGFEEIPYGTSAKDGFEYGNHMSAWEKGDPEDHMSDYTRISTAYDIPFTKNSYLLIDSDAGQDGGGQCVWRVFAGIIKNKSELIKLLKQLNIQ